MRRRVLPWKRHVGILVLGAWLGALGVIAVRVPVWVVTPVTASATATSAAAAGPSAASSRRLASCWTAAAALVVGMPASPSCGATASRIPAMPS